MSLRFRQPSYPLAAEFVVWTVYFQLVYLPLKSLVEKRGESFPTQGAGLPIPFYFTDAVTTNMASTAAQEVRVPHDGHTNWTPDVLWRRFHELE